MSNILGYNGAPLALNGAPITCSSVGTDTSDATITSAAQILYPYTGYSQGIKYTGSIQSQAAQTIYPSISDQTIASGQYLSGMQTIKGVVLTNLLAENIKNGVTIEVGDSADSDRIVTGTFRGGSIALADASYYTLSSGNAQINFTGLSGTPRFYYLFILSTPDTTGIFVAGGLASSNGSESYGQYRSSYGLYPTIVTATSGETSLAILSDESTFASSYSYYLYYIY